ARQVADRRTGQGRDRGKPVPLRHIPARRPRGAHGRAGRRLTMSRKVTIKTGYLDATKNVEAEIHDLDAEPWGLDAKLRVVGTDVAGCAETEDALDDALAAIVVKYDPQPVAVTTDDAMKEGAAQVDPKHANLGESKPQEQGNPDKALADADAVVEAEFRTQVQT